MTVFGLDNRTLLLVAGSLNVMLPMCLWLVLGMPRQRAPRLWCLAGVVAGTGLVLMGLRGTVPDGLSYLGGQSLMLLGLLMLAQSLRMDLGRPWPWRWVLLIPAVYGLLVWGLLPIASVQTLGVLLRAVNLIGVLLIAAMAWRVAEAENSHNALLIATAASLQATATLTNLVNASLGSADIQTMEGSTLGVSASLLMLLVPLTLAMGYLGLTLERSRQRQVQLAQDMARTQQWREKREALVRRDRERLLGLLGDSLGHEILQPLTAALLRVQLGQRQLRTGASSAALLPAVDEVVQNIRRASDTVARVRQFVRPFSAQSAPVDVRELVRSVSQLMRQEAINRDIELHYPPNGEAAWVMGDALQLSQALLQVMRNAVSALIGQQQRTIWLTLEEVDREIRLKVTDSGPGFPPEVLRLGQSELTPWPQSLQGIGLFVVQSIVQRHHGMLLLENAPMGGAVVTLVLPRHRADATAPTPAREPLAVNAAA